MNHTLNPLRILHKTIKKIDGAYAPSTIRAYGANFERFIQFCEKRGIDALPANPLDLALYIAQLTKNGLKSSSIRIAVASISSIHKLNCLSDPTQHPDVKIEMRRMHRILGRSPKQAFGITAPILETMLGATDNNLRGVRDRALLLLAYDSMCRRSELVSLRVEDIKANKTEDGGEIKIRLRKSKTDQELQGRWIYLSKRSTDAVKVWIHEAKLNYGFLFRGINNASEITQELQSGQINRIFKHLAQKGKLSKDIVECISGHSMRIGAAQDLLNNGASLAMILNRGRWTKIDTLMRYLENTSQHQEIKSIYSY